MKFVVGFIDEKIRQIKKILAKFPFIMNSYFLIFKNYCTDRPADYCFPSDLIQTNGMINQINWKYLRRGYDDEESIKVEIQKIRLNTMVTYDGLLSLSAIARYLEERKIKGSFVETGVCRGGSAAIMAIASKKYGNSKRMIHLFDSFQGLPRPSLEKDYQRWMEKE